MIPMRRSRRRRFKQQKFDVEQPLLATWLLRLLLGFHAVRKSFFDEKTGYSDDDAASFLQLPEFDTDKPIAMREFKILLEEKLNYFEKKTSPTLVVFRNIELLSTRLDLCPFEQLILAYAVLTEDNSVWTDIFRNHQLATQQQFINYLSCMLEHDVQDVKRYLSKHSFLRQSGLIRIEKRAYEDAQFDLMRDLKESLLAEHNTVNDLMSCFLTPTKAPSLSVKDYPHTKQHIALMQSMITSALESGEKGVNILIYGTPGTGKTELVKVLAYKLHLNLFEVKTEDDDGDAIRSRERLSSYRLSQHLLAQDKESLILFDEVEDVFPSRAFSFFGTEMKSGENKGWINKTLEENATPAIWICNQVNQIDPAFLRRFDYVMELNTPPKAVRLNIVQSYFAGKDVNPAFLERLAEHKQVSPAQIEKLSKIARKVSLVEGDMESTLEQVVNNSLKAMSLKPLSVQRRTDTHYSLDYLNTSVDMPSLIRGLQRSKQGNLCFYGAPGTGKSALAAHIAKELGLPLMSKKTSDIMSMWVGGTEKNIADMFSEAKEEGAVLVLDEADSLLRDRRNANQSWEVTQVNELLVQMENFEGLFICSTNLMDNLDQASLRRFAMKVEFRYLLPHQALKMLERECVDKVDAQQARIIQQMSMLAPGDFSAVKKRLDILGIKATAQAFSGGLHEEVSIKEGSEKRSIGFLH